MSTAIYLAAIMISEALGFEFNIDEYGKFYAGFLLAFIVHDLVALGK